MVCIALLIVISAGTAHAYIDPAAGSIALQLILGGVGGALVLGKLYFRKLVGLFRRHPPEPEREADGPPDRS